MAQPSAGLGSQNINSQGIAMSYRMQQASHREQAKQLKQTERHSHMYQTQLIQAAAPPSNIRHSQSLDKVPQTDMALGRGNQENVAYS